MNEDEELELLREFAEKVAQTRKEYLERLIQLMNEYEDRVVQLEEARYEQRAREREEKEE